MLLFIIHFLTFYVVTLYILYSPNSKDDLACHKAQITDYSYSQNKLLYIYTSIPQE